MDDETAMLPALKTVVWLLDDFGVFSSLVVLLASAATVFVFRQRLSTCLPARLNRIVQPLLQRDSLVERIARRCGELRNRLNFVRRAADDRLGNRLETLDRLIVEADREIVRLQSTLQNVEPASEQSKSSPPQSKPGRSLNWLAQAFLPKPDFTFDERPSSISTRDVCDACREFSATQRQMIVHLGRAGYTVDAIAELVNVPTTKVRQILSEGENRGLADAA